MTFGSNSSALCFATLTLAACATVPPPPMAPEPLPRAGQFLNAENEAIEADVSAADWWQRFEDPILIQLVETALAENKDLAVARANIDIARAILASETLERSPATSTTAAADVGRATREGADTELTASGRLGATWEIDLFDRIESEIQSAAFSLQQARELRRDTAVTIASETALAYVDLRGNQVRLSVAQSNADLQGESVDLLRVLFENGRATRLDLERAESQYRTTLASLPLFQANIRTSAIRLSVLTGQSDFSTSDAWALTVEAVPIIPAPPASLNIGTPDALIRRRPDIRAAEADIASRFALGAADRARLFPTLTFNADLLALFTENIDLEDSFGFAIGPAISWEGPDLRRVEADIEISDAQTRAAFAVYENAVINALAEVETALIAYGQEQVRREDLEAAAIAAQRAFELARLRFDEGLDDFLDVIDAQRTLLDAQDRVENNKLEATRQAISTYRALGGIWQDEAFADRSAEGE
ncbi:MAG: efflux transporter outer membrane subunit [Pseudomonadota bacterium]